MDFSRAYDTWKTGVNTQKKLLIDDIAAFFLGELDSENFRQFGKRTTLRYCVHVETKDHFERTFASYCDKTKNHSYLVSHFSSNIYPMPLLASIFKSACESLLRNLKIWTSTILVSPS